MIQNFLGDQRGDSAIQYALVAGILSVVVLAAGLAMREPLTQLYEGVGERAAKALNAPPPADEE